MTKMFLSIGWRVPTRHCVIALLLLSASLFAARARAQDNYEIQVYPSETMAPKTLLVELHSNFTVEGSTSTEYGMLPTQHQEHETIELTEGINDWSEIGFYIFTAEKSGNGVQWVGDHIRPRVRIPPRWHWPVGVSLSSEFGYARPAFSNPTWSWQIMPIVDQTVGRWYWSVNTTMVWDLHVVPPPADSTAQEKLVYYRECRPQRPDLRPCGNPHVCAVEILQHRRGILFVLRPVRKFCFPAQPAATILPGREPVCFAQVGNQYWCGLGRDGRDRPSDREVHYRTLL